METDYIKNFQRQLEIRRYLFWVLLFLMQFGLPTWFYIDSYVATSSFEDNLSTERINERMNQALKFTLILLLISSAIVIPIFLFINRFFNHYQNVISQLTPAEIQVLKKINDSLTPLGRYIPSFIITSQNLFVFSLNFDIIPFNLITSHKFTVQQTKYGFMYKVEINTSDGNFYNFTISSNQVQLEQLKLRLNSSVAM